MPAGSRSCDRSDCMAMRATVRCGVRVMYRGELVGQIDWDRCVGCRSCMRVCQFGAIGYSAANRKAFIDARQCYGCGACRSVCSHEAIGLAERTTVAEAAKLW